jgi:drug/metabolite transporter (DMT)-like permease
LRSVWGRSVAFFAWDIGMKRGDIRLLGAASYITPLLSTLLLILCGYAKRRRHWVSLHC